MIKTILVPLDGSQRAEAILPEVLSLAEALAARVVLLRVIEPFPAIVSTHDAWPVTYVEQIDHEVREASKYLQRIAEMHPGIGQIQTRVLHGAVIESICQTAQEVEADLIAIASHGRSGLQSVFYGSVTAGVLQRIERPLLVIRSQ